VYLKGYCSFVSAQKATCLSVSAKMQADQQQTQSRESIALKMEKRILA
jgi:hypothetical protein